MWSSSLTALFITPPLPFNKTQTQTSIAIGTYVYVNNTKSSGQPIFCVQWMRSYLKHINNWVNMDIAWWTNKYFIGGLVVLVYIWPFTFCSSCSFGRLLLSPSCSPSHITKSLTSFLKPAWEWTTATAWICNWYAVCYLLHHMRHAIIPCYSNIS